MFLKEASNVTRTYWGAPWAATSLMLWSLRLEVKYDSNSRALGWVFKKCKHGTQRLVNKFTWGYRESRTFGLRNFDISKALGALSSYFRCILKPKPWKFLFLELGTLTLGA